MVSYKIKWPKITYQIRTEHDLMSSEEATWDQIRLNKIRLDGMRLGQMIPNYIRWYHMTYNTIRFHQTKTDEIIIGEIG